LQLLAFLTLENWTKIEREKSCPKVG